MINVSVTYWLTGSWLKGQVNLRAHLGKHELRHDSLGRDLDGRVYYVLTPRPVEDDGRPPMGWASGLLVWGKGVARQAGQEADVVPTAIERWTHFGKSQDVRQLVKWLDWRVSDAAKRLSEAEKKGKAARPGETTPRGSRGKVTARLHASASRQTMLGVEIPSRRAKSHGADIKSRQKQPYLSITSPRLPGSDKAERKAATIKTGEVDEDEDEAGNASDSSSSSVLSSIPETTEDLLAELEPEGYEPSAEMVQEEGGELVRRVTEVTEWLEVLEWKGFGEL
jgi:hypothetical protein